MAVPPEARIASRIIKSPIAFGTRRPEATVAAFSNSSANRLPSLNARTMGAQVSLWTDDHPRTLGAYPAHLLHLVKGLPHADQPRAAAGRVEDDVGDCRFRISDFGVRTVELSRLFGLLQSEICNPNPKSS